MISTLLVCLATVSSAGSGVSWESAGWGGGDIFPQVVCDPQNHGRVWALTWQGGILRSGDLGATWQWSNGNLPVLQGVALVPDPASRDGLYFVSLRGIWHTGDGGRTWQILPGTEKFRFRRLQSLRPLVVCSKTGYLCVGTADGKLFISRTGGRQWVEVPWGNARPIRALVEVAYMGTVVVARAEAGGLFLFRPFQWRRPRPARKGPPFAASDLLADTSLPYPLYAACGKYGLWKSDRHGELWERIEREEIPEDQDVLFLTQAGRGRRRVLYAAGRGFLLRSTGPKRWEKVAVRVRFDTAVNPARTWNARLSMPTFLSGGTTPEVLFLADYFGLYRTTSARGEALFTEVVRGAANHAVWDVALSPEGILYVAADGAGVLTSSDGGKSYESFLPRHYPTEAGRYTAISIGKDGRLLCASVTKAGDRIQVFYGNASGRRVDGAAKGFKWPKVLLKPPPASEGPWTVRVSPAASETGYLLLTGSRPRLWRTADGGRSWTAGQLPAGCKPTGAFACDRLRPDRVALGAHNGIYLSQDGGRVWERVLETKSAICALLSASIRRSYALEEKGTLYVSDTAGSVWKQAGSVPGGYASALCADPGEEDHLFAASGAGLFFSNDGGVTWRALPRAPVSLPPVVCLLYDRPHGILTAGTRGAGLWRIPVGF